MASADVWTAGTLSLSPWSGLVPIVAVLYAVLHLVMGAGVGAARKKFGIPYPTLYAVPGTPREYGNKEGAAAKLVEGKNALVTESEAYGFNCVQRGHQNFVENSPMIMLLLLVSWPFPIISGVAGLIQLAGRYLYFIGYSRDAKSRMWGAALIYPSLLVLLGTAMASAVFLFRGTASY